MVTHLSFPHRGFGGIISHRKLMVVLFLNKIDKILKMYNFTIEFFDKFIEKFSCFRGLPFPEPVVFALYIIILIFPSIGAKNETLLENAFF